MLGLPLSHKPPPPESQYLSSCYGRQTHSNENIFVVVPIYTILTYLSLALQNIPIVLALLWCNNIIIIIIIVTLLFDPINHTKCHLFGYQIYHTQEHFHCFLRVTTQFSRGQKFNLSRFQY